jgi:hypothetical protein
MKLNWKHSLGGLALAAMALPVWAHTDTIQYQAEQAETIAGVQLSPGSYELKADDSTNKVTVEQNGSVVATVNCQWKQLPEKAERSEVLSNQSQVTELHFSGKTEAATFAR